MEILKTKELNHKAILTACFIISLLYFIYGITTKWIITIDLDYYSQGIIKNSNNLTEYPYPIAESLNQLHHLAPTNAAFKTYYFLIVFTLDGICVKQLSKISIKYAYLWILSTILLGAITISRLDFFVTFGILFTLLNHSNVTKNIGSLIGYATKLWPISLNFIGWKNKENKKPILYSILGIIFINLITILSPNGGIKRIFTPLSHQAVRGYQVESTLGSIAGILPKKAKMISHNGSWEYTNQFLNNHKYFVNIFSILGYLTILYILYKTKNSKEYVLTAFIITLIFIITSGVLSPQYITWLIPFIVLINNRTIRILGFSIFILTQIEIEWIFQYSFENNIHFYLFSYDVLVRNILLILMLIKAIELIKIKKNYSLQNMGFVSKNLRID